MRILLQRVKRASVSAAGGEKTSIGKGLLLLVGIGRDDNEKDLERLSKKIAGLRIFEDTGGKLNLDVREVKGKIMSVPQFTLYADTKKGNRPGFEGSAAPDMARAYWNKFNNMLEGEGLEVEEGVFGADMEVELVNDGPVTIWLDSKER